VIFRSIATWSATVEDLLDSLHCNKELKPQWKAVLFLPTSFYTQKDLGMRKGPFKLQIARKLWSRGIFSLKINKSVGPRQWHLIARMREFPSYFCFILYFFPPLFYVPKYKRQLPSVPPNNPHDSLRLVFSFGYFSHSCWLNIKFILFEDLVEAKTRITVTITWLTMSKQASSE
jgi:ADP-heptose:LPS heptosyltransferase